MGTYASNFYRNGDQILTEVTDPSQANWIVLHSEICKMTVPEVQRIWSRFLMLQPDEKGNLPRTCFLQTNTRFGQKLLNQIPITDDDRITFQTCCNAVSWLSKSSLESKLRDLPRRMKTLFVLACILAITVPFEAGSSSESKERRYPSRYCPPCPPCPPYSYYPPAGQPPFFQPYPGAPFPGAPFPVAPFPGAPPPAPANPAAE
ncbi:uncharacterized protein LOC143841291 isoform X3 [Paroedura picta]|uniref:uncharacterized protein LOC143841291 isoform X3 n=1 Tax=Paroedura picta TaxID=143630 RepID=UPI00405732BA